MGGPNIHSPKAPNEVLAFVFLGFPAPDSVPIITFLSDLGFGASFEVVELGSMESIMDVSFCCPRYDPGSSK
jgi:hypothetical protein